MDVSPCARPSLLDISRQTCDPGQRIGRLSIELCDLVLFGKAGSLAILRVMLDDQGGIERLGNSCQPLHRCERFRPVVVEGWHPAVFELLLEMRDITGRPGPVDSQAVHAALSGKA